MSFKINYIESKNHILVEIEGVFSENDFHEILNTISTSNEYPSNINAIYDLSKMSFKNIDTNFLESLSEAANQYSKIREGAKTVYVCPEDIQFGMTRVWEVLASDVHVNIMVKRTISEAINWLEN